MRDALYMITPSQDVAKVIKAVYGVVEQYKHVAEILEHGR